MDFEISDFGKCNALEGEQREDCRCLHFVPSSEDEYRCLCNHTVNFHAPRPAAARQERPREESKEQRSRSETETRPGGEKPQEGVRPPADYVQTEAEAKAEIEAFNRDFPDPAILHHYAAFLDGLKGPETSADFALSPHPQYGYMSVKCKPCGRVLGLSRSKSRSRFLNNIRSHLVSASHLRRMEGRPAAAASEAGSSGGAGG